MVEIEVRKSEPETATEKTTTLDIGDIINKVRDLVSSARQMSPDGKPVSVKLESFNFTFGKENGEYDLNLTTRLTIAPKD